jgi:hypothetical protein
MYYSVEVRMSDPRALNNSYDETAMAVNNIIKSVRKKFGHKLKFIHGDECLAHNAYISTTDINFFQNEVLPELTKRYEELQVKFSIERPWVVFNPKTDQSVNPLDFLYLGYQFGYQSTSQKWQKYYNILGIFSDAVLHGTATTEQAVQNCRAKLVEIGFNPNDWTKSK